MSQSRMILGEDLLKRSPHLPEMISGEDPFQQSSNKECDLSDLCSSYRKENDSAKKEKKNLNASLIDSIKMTWGEDPQNHFSSNMKLIVSNFSSHSSTTLICDPQNKKIEHLSNATHFLKTIARNDKFGVSNKELESSKPSSYPSTFSSSDANILNKQFEYVNDALCSLEREAVKDDNVQSIGSTLENTTNIISLVDTKLNPKVKIISGGDLPEELPIDQGVDLSIISSNSCTTFSSENIINKKIKKLKDAISSCKTEAAKDGKMRSLEWAIDNVTKFGTFKYRHTKAKPNTVYTSTAFVEKVLIWFRKGCGAYIDNNIYVCDKRQNYATEAEKKDFREKLSNQILELTGQEPRIVKKNDGGYAIHNL